MHDLQLKIEYLPATKLKPYEKNTRRHEKIDVDNIAKSIKKYGMNDPIGIWGEDNLIVEGHGRLLACRQLGIEQVPVVRLDHMSEKERREYAIAHNATAELSQWDLEIMPDELSQLDLSDFDFDLLPEEKEDINIDEFFESAPRTEAKKEEPERIQCPHCGEWFEK